ncbi:MAG TPA: ATP-binding protein [Methylomirabilota bacterium]|nr:ATP-binding protein [Methylomirabilota bacterium]
MEYQLERPHTTTLSTPSAFTFVPGSQNVNDVETLSRLIEWFQHSSLRLMQEYRRLERRVADLNAELADKNRELRASLREREEARAYLLAVLESLKAGVLVLDRELRPALTNRRLRELVGEVDAARVIQLLGERLAACLKRGERDFLPLESERVIHGPTGASLPIHLTISEVQIAEVDSAAYAVVFQDMSRVKRLEAEAARARRLASLGEMAASVAHEVRSPLGGIELYASLLKERPEGDTCRLASQILNAVHRLHATISHLLSFAAEPRITGEELPVALLIQDMMELAAPVLRAGKWVVEIEIEPGLPPLWGDRGLLTQVLLNLVTNACDAMPEGGRMQIVARRSSFSTMNGRIHRELEIRVIDEGVGIPPENREKIFDPFFTTKPKGTGLGLALTHKIICAHHGSIEVTPAPERGSCFSLFLPVAERQMQLDREARE